MRKYLVVSFAIVTQNESASSLSSTGIACRFDKLVEYRPFGLLVHSLVISDYDHIIIVSSTKVIIPD